MIPAADVVFSPGFPFRFSLLPEEGVPHSPLTFPTCPAAEIVTVEVAAALVSADPLLYSSLPAFAVLAFDYLKDGKAVDAAEHAPEYLRLSQAERERNERAEK